MLRTAMKSALIAIGVALVSGEALAQAVSSTTVACSTKRRLQTAINAVPASTVATITVTGTCNENIVVPHGKTIAIIGGNATARITPANNRLPAVVSNGNTTLQRLTIINATGSAPTLVEARNGRIDIIASDLAATNVADLIEVWFGSTGRIINSRIANVNGSAIDVSRNSSVDLWGDPSFPVGPASSGTVVSSSNGFYAIGCNIGGSITSRTFGSGTVSITNSRNGIFAETCTLNLRGLTMSNLQGSAINGFQNDIRLSNMSITNSASDNEFTSAVNSELSRINVEGVTFSNNLYGDIAATTDTSVLVKGYNAGGINTKSSFPDSANGKSFRCDDGGTIFVNTAEVLQDIASSYGNIPCVIIR